MIKLFSLTWTLIKACFQLGNIDVQASHFYSDRVELYKLSGNGLELIEIKR